MKKNITLLILLIANLCFAQKQLDAIQGTASGINNYSVTINSITEQTIYNGQKILVKFTNGNTTASTLKVTVAGGTSYPVKDIETKSGTGISNGDITAGCQLLFSYNSTFDSWQIIGGTSGGASQWTTTGSDIYYNTGNVGINNSSPDAKLDVVSTSTVNPVASFSVNTSGSTNATGVNINAEGGTTTDALVVNSKSNVSGGINNAIVALATTANGGYNNALTSVAQNGDYNYGGKIAAQGGVDAVGLSISASGASGNNNAIDITAGNFKYTPGTEGSGKVLTSDANGVASWQTPSAGGSASVTITDDNSTNATMYPTWVAANSGSQPVKVSSTKMIFNPSTGWVGLNTTSPLGGLDISHNGYNSGNASLVLGADGGSFNLYTRTNSTTKIGTIAFPHYLNAEEPFTFVYGTSTSTNNILYIGGGLAQQNAATQIRFYPGATYTTTTGTPMATITTTGLGINTLSYQSLLQVVGTGSTSATSSVKILNSANDTIFKIRDDGKLFYKDGNQGAGKVLTSDAIGMATWQTPSSGSVTSVAQSFTGGLISVAGSPITSSGTLALTVAGTSGGIPYFSSSSTWASSAALTANALMIGGGAGAAPSTTTTGTGVLTALGVNTGSAGAFVVNGGALGTPSSGTATNLTGLPLTTGVTGTLPIANGGTGQTTANAAFNALSPNTTRGDITVMNATVNARLALGSAGKILRSDGTDLVYSTNTFPNTTGLNEILYATSANVIGSSANFKLGSNLTVLSPTGGVATGIVLTQSANNGTAASSYTSIDFNVPTTGLIGQFLSTASNYSAAGVNVAGNSLCLASEATAGQLALMATGASGYITFNTGGFGTGNERLRILSNGNIGIGTTSPASKLDVEGGVAIGATYSGTTAAPTNGAIIEGLVGMGVSSPSAKLHIAAATTTVTPSMIINPATGTLRSITSGAINFHESGELLEVVGADGWSEVIGAWGTPTISGGIGTPTYAVTSGSTDVNVKVEYTSSMSPVDDAVLFVITYERALHRAGTVSVCPRNRAAALTPIYIEATTTGFTVKLATSTADTPVWDQTRYWGFQVKN